MKIDLIGNVETLIVNNVEKKLSKPHYLLGVFYDGELEKAVMQFLDENGSRLVLIPDPVNHKPYFLSRESVDEIKSNKSIVNHEGFLDVLEVYKIDPLTMNRVRLSKIVTKTPTDVAKLRNFVSKAWEARIKYHDNYIFDNNLIPGMKYIVGNELNRNRIEIVKPVINQDL
ncbi:MAG: type B DNA-directed DNA polymerase, partial [Desulfurococcaceae archaeon]